MAISIATGDSTWLGWQMYLLSNPAGEGREVRNDDEERFQRALSSAPQLPPLYIPESQKERL